MSAFDPATWLAQFEAVGGWYIVTGDRLNVGWLVEGRPESDQIEAGRLYREIRHRADRRELVRQHMERRRQVA